MGTLSRFVGKTGTGAKIGTSTFCLSGTGTATHFGFESGSGTGLDSVPMGPYGYHTVPT
jgi:hypothetical protein